jgi:deoxyribodipyrimidine photo-lyase
MNLKDIHNSRIQILNDLDLRRGAYVLYWMQQSQRAEYNHALEYAVQQANKMGQGVVVLFGLMGDYPEANLRHYTFMLEGLQETQAALAKRGCRVVQIESDVVVPLEVVSGKAEYAARTIRPKIHKYLKDYLLEFKPTKIKKTSLKTRVSGLDLSDIEAVAKNMSLDKGVLPVSDFFSGGTSRAKRIFKEFLRRRFEHYVANRNQPQTDDVSHMSKYLHFGHISPLYLALQILKTEKRFKQAREAFLEELIVRRELAMNFVYYTPDYDAYACLPAWAKKTLAEHKKDRREYRYTRRQLENAQTHDDYWNAAMREMKYTGFMHNYMRMYWGKKILEWSGAPERALINIFSTAATPTHTPA